MVLIKECKNSTERPFKYTPFMSVKEVDPSEQPANMYIRKFYHHLDNKVKVCKSRAKNLQSTDRIYVHADFYVPGHQTGNYIVIWHRNLESKVRTFMSIIFGQSERRNQLLQVEDGGFTSYETLARHYIDVNG